MVSAEPDAVHEDLLLPVALFPSVPPPVEHHAELGEGKSDEHVDAVEHHHELDRAPGEKQEPERRGSGEDDPVLDDEPLAEEAELLREPPVHGHVGKHARSAEEPRLRRREEEHRLGEERHRHEDGAKGTPPRRDAGEQGGIQGPARLVTDVEQEVADHQAGGEKRQGEGHVAHGGLGGGNPRLAKDRHGVAHGLDAGERPRAHAVGAQDEKEHPERADLGRCLSDIACRPGGKGPHVGHVHRHTRTQPPPGA